jgi:hypothetical protein
MPEVYRPRHPERTDLYKLFERDFDRFTSEYDERFEPGYGPLRRVVQRTVHEYLECGRPEGGFARIRCPSCRGEHLLAFSCQTRNFCPSCQAKRAALFAEKLATDILADAPHRHVVFTVPKVIRGLFERERRLLSILTRCAHRSTETLLREVVDDPKARIGTIASIQTFGSYAANFHPHVHALITEGAFHPAAGGGGEFERVQWWDLRSLTGLFRRMVLRSLREAERLRGETEEMLLSWQHPGFHVHATEPVLPDDKDRQEHLARYITRAPLRLDAVKFTDERDRVQVRTPPDPATGRRVMELDRLELIRHLCTQIPAPRQHLVRYYGWYSNRARGARGEVRRPATPDDMSPAAVARRRSWARLLRKIFEVDPLLCPQCGVEMRPVAVIREVKVVDRILGHLWRVGGNDPWEGTALRGPPTSPVESQ